MPAMKILSLIVIDEAGVRHVWEGDNGHVTFMSLVESKESKQSPGKHLGTQVQAYITLPTEPRDFMEEPISESEEEI